MTGSLSDGKYAIALIIDDLPTPNPYRWVDRLLCLLILPPLLMLIAKACFRCSNRFTLPPKEEEAKAYSSSISKNATSGQIFDESRELYGKDLETYREFIKKSNTLSGDSEREELLLAYRHAGELGDVEALNALATHYVYQGRMKLALYYCELAADQGDVSAMKKMGKHCSFRDDSDYYDLNRAVKWYTKAAEADCLDSLRALTQIYEGMTYHVISRDFVLNLGFANRWAKLAVATGDPLLVCSVGSFWAQVKNFKKAIECYEKADFSKPSQFASEIFYTEGQRQTSLAECQRALVQ